LLGYSQNGIRRHRAVIGHPRRQRFTWQVL
jgi:hypothetical protein